MKIKLTILLIVVVAAVILTAAYFTVWRTPAATDTSDAAVTIVRTKGGYEPEVVTIKVGQTVAWVNEHDEYHWPASDLHPTHGIYPEFDPRSPVAPGETWQFTFAEVGEWAYHDHLRANVVGKIIVTE